MPDPLLGERHLSALQFWLELIVIAACLTGVLTWIWLGTRLIERMVGL